MSLGSGGPGISIEARWGLHQRLLGARVLRGGLVDPSSVSLGWLDDQGLPLDFVYVNSFADSRYMVESCAQIKLARGATESSAAGHVNNDAAGRP